MSRLAMELFDSYDQINRKLVLKILDLVSNRNNKMQKKKIVLAASMRRDASLLSTVRVLCWVYTLCMTAPNRLRGVRAMSSLLKNRAYEVPSWAEGKFKKLPEHGRLSLGNFPSPLYQITMPADLPDSSILKVFQDNDVKLWIKRDDMTGGVELGGNKIRKLEFLLAEAVAEGYTSVITIGGEQSNHCRATASAARMLGLKPHLILRTKRADTIMSSKVTTNEKEDGGSEENGNDKDEFGTTGNILIDRMVGSVIYTCSPGEYGRVGSEELVQRLASYIEREENEKPYCIPVGGSNGLGTWGYINAVDELQHQMQQEARENGDDRENDNDDEEGMINFDHVVFACGSGGTAAGLAIGFALCPTLSPQLHAVGVCDDPDYFYRHITKIVHNEMGFHLSEAESEKYVRDHMTAHQGKGLGYGASTKEELDFVMQFAMETGVALDPVYSGKAMYHFAQMLRSDPENFRGKNVLLWHTGGALGLYDKVNCLANLQQHSPVKRLDVYGRKDAGSVPI